MEAAHEIRIMAADFGMEIYTKRTQSVGHARELARGLKGRTDIDCVIVVGEDGTVAEAAAGLIDGGVELPLGVVPSGSGNDFCASLMGGKKPPRNIPDLVSQSLTAIKRRNFREVDAIKVVCGGKTDYCVNIASAGFDAAIVNRAETLKKTFGGASYIISTLLNSLTYKPREMKIRVDGGEERVEKMLLTAVCNGSYYGGGFKISPDAVADDGKITLCAIKSLHKLKVLALFPLVLFGKHINLKEVGFEECESVTIDIGEKTILNIDGNISAAAGEASFEIMRAALKVAVL